MRYAYDEEVKTVRRIAAERARMQDETVCDDLEADLDREHTREEVVEFVQNLFTRFVCLNEQNTMSDDKQAFTSFVSDL